MMPGQPPIESFHPEPKNIFRLWQIFVQRVNPLTKIVHVPTTQQRILDASFNVTEIPVSLAALLFAVYASAITALTVEECQAQFNEHRDFLALRYRDTCLRALVSADFLVSHDLETLQASAIFLFNHAETDLSTSLVGSLVRLAQRMGLHLDPPPPDPKRLTPLSIFEREIRVRMWWQIRGLEARICSATIPDFRLLSPYDSIGNLRLPFNINDSDLHPNMTTVPVEHNGHTEMSPLLMKFQLIHWFRWDPEAGKLFECIVSKNDADLAGLCIKDDVIDGLQKIYQSRFLQVIDLSIPTQNIIHLLGKLSISRLRFKVHHPRVRFSTSNGGELYVTQEESEILFKSALTMMEIVPAVMRSGFSPHLVSHFSYWPLVDAMVYVTSELRRRLTGQDVESAWKHMEILYHDYAITLEDYGNPFMVQYGDLVLEAWEARVRQLMLDNGGEEVPLPGFIARLKEKRQLFDQDPMQLSQLDAVGGFNGLGFFDEVGWEYWNNFLTL